MGGGGDLACNVTLYDVTVNKSNNTCDGSGPYQWVNPLTAGVAYIRVFIFY